MTREGVMLVLLQEGGKEEKKKNQRMSLKGELREMKVAARETGK